MATSQLSRLSSSIANGWLPYMWQMEFTLQVAWCNRNTRTRPAHTNAVKPANGEPPESAKPSTNRIARPSSAHSGKYLSTQRMTGSLRRSGAKRLAEVRCPSNSQPMCECQRPLSTPRTPSASCVCGECGSPSSSVNAWWRRWSATQWMTAPCTDIEPRIANVARTHGFASKARWVSMRWKPIVTPKPTRTYITARIPRSSQVTPDPHSSTRAVTKPTKGRTTAKTVIRRSSADAPVWVSAAMDWRLGRSRRGFTSESSHPRRNFLERTYNFRAHASADHRLRRVSGELAIRTIGLTKDFGGGRGLFGLDLGVRRGEVLGFLGPNGAGKSTT